MRVGESCNSRSRLTLAVVDSRAPSSTLVDFRFKILVRVDELSFRDARSNIQSTLMQTLVCQHLSFSFDQGFREVMISVEIQIRVGSCHIGHEREV